MANDPKVMTFADWWNAFQAHSFQLPRDRAERAWHARDPEIASLHRRIEELEAALREASIG